MTVILLERKKKKSISPIISPILGGLQRAEPGTQQSCPIVVFPFDFAALEEPRSEWGTGLQTLPGPPWQPGNQERILTLLPPPPELPRASRALHHPCCQPVFKEYIEFLGIREGSVGAVCALGHVRAAESLCNRRSTIGTCTAVKHRKSAHFSGRTRAGLLHHRQHLAVLRRAYQAPLCSLTRSLPFSLAWDCPD